MTIDASTRFDTDAATRGLSVEVVERPAADSLQHAAEMLGIDPGDIVKTLVVKRQDGGFLLALVPGGRSIAWKKLRTVVGVNKLSMPDAATALQASGYERGTITPIGATGDLPVYADDRIVGRRVALGAGRHGASAFVDADDLVAAYGATVADITDEEPQRA
ncbi:Cys-tRNA(Pro) deacylase [Curtobacterium sp. PhB172]|uniref:aminoacyl-tRNA deacylase n=1 Tax=unclassified Curtobacterium TaxID=257496 RepID=UPI000F4A60EF|nr:MULTISPECIES: YbaK/EbsC family protein [unclassified Curtobacterium]ROQ05935.1 Cys-tRNA(Pro) deacylase [Curtobacterium sp. PhB171]ROQ22918.1 Cys-tRNA(Pro) deacylase [Curtobacterium sp. PhB170]ROS34130.1 Cys-tRNA(Pro) deacylase [Curtobacterium sp. PhB131]ROS63013.1 Cys-tRNA(Pro) deacylase [Curtobacterium sp. PhB172]ROS66729.1 Cys-tRNA(Pro) deacylase [Curtobacterium sp. PhB141]